MVCINLVERKNIRSTINAVLLKGWIQAVLILLSIFLLSTFFTFGVSSFYKIYAIQSIMFFRNKLICVNRVLFTIFIGKKNIPTEIRNIFWTLVEMIIRFFSDYCFVDDREVEKALQKNFCLLGKWLFFIGKYLSKQNNIFIDQS